MSTPNNASLRTLLAAGGLAVLSSSAVFGAAGTFTSTTAGDWFTASNWLDNAVASGGGFTATINSTTGSNVGLNLDQDLTIGGITFGAAGQSDATGRNINSSGGHTLTLATGTSTASVLDVRGTHTISAQILGTVGLNKTNAGKLTLSGNNLYTGVTSVSNGNLTVSSNTGLGASGAGNGTVVNFTSGQFPQLHFTNNVETSEDITLRLHQSSGTAGATIASNLLYNDSGDTIISGAVTLERSTTGGTNTLYGYGIQGSAGTITLNGGVTGSLTGNQAGGTYADPNQLQLRTRAVTATINITGTISDGTIGTGGVSVYTVADSTGISRLSGANTYSGRTVHQGGTLLINNTSGSGTGTGAVAVLSGATFGGTGTIAPTGSNGITFASGAIIAPGDVDASGAAIADGKALTINLGGTTGAATFSSGAIIALNLNTAASTVAEQLAFTGLSAGLARVHFANNVVNFSITGGLLADGIYTLASFDQAGAYDGQLVIGTGLESYTASLVHNTNSIQLVIGSAIPESASAGVLAGLAVIGFAALRRRRR